MARTARSARRSKRPAIPCEVLPLPAGVAKLGDAGAKGPARLLGLVAKGLLAASATLGYRSRLARRFRDERPDLLVTSGMKMHLLGTLAAPAGLPIVWDIQDYLGPRVAMARLLRVLARRPGLEIVALTESVAADVRETLRGRAPVRVIYSAVDLDRFSPGPGDGPSLDRDAGLDDSPLGTVRVGLVATFAKWKGHDLFLEAVSRIDPSLPARFYVVGGPIYRSTGSQVTLESLHERAERLGLAGRIGFTGHRSDPAEVFRSLDVVVHASTEPEPFGRVIVEGMACGRAVVAMEEGGAAELFRDGEEALACPPRDAASLAGRIARLVEDADLRQRLGRAARAAAEARFDRSRLAEDWARVYDRPSAAFPTASAAGPVAR